MSEKRKLPSTSIDAYEKAKEMIGDHHQKILSVLRVESKANYEQIAKKAGMDRHQVGRRLKELEERQYVFKPGTKSKTKSGCSAFDYSITDSGKNLQLDSSNIYVPVVKAVKNEILPAVEKKNLFDI